MNGKDGNKKHTLTFSKLDNTDGRLYWAGEARIKDSPDITRHLLFIYTLFIMWRNLMLNKRAFIL